MFAPPYTKIWKDHTPPFVETYHETNKKARMNFLAFIQN